MRPETGEQVRLFSSQFGELVFDRNIVLEFPDGLVGFEDLKRYIIADVEECEPFQWLLSVDDPDLGLPILNATFVPVFTGPDGRSEYRLSKAELNGWPGETDPEDLFVYLVVTLGTSAEEVTANLKAPLLIDVKRGIGKQIILTAGDCPVTYPLFREEQTIAKEGPICSCSQGNWERPSRSAIMLK